MTSEFIVINLKPNSLIVKLKPFALDEFKMII